MNKQEKAEAKLKDLGYLWVDGDWRLESSFREQLCKAKLSSRVIKALPVYFGSKSELSQYVEKGGNLMSFENIGLKSSQQVYDWLGFDYIKATLDQ